MTVRRVAFDLDGTIADLSSAYREIETRLFGTRSRVVATPEPPASADDVREKPKSDDDRSAAVWRAIEQTPNFWAMLQPLEDGLVQRLWKLSHRHRWEVFFITQRPPTAGESVQLQSQRWLAAQGFELPTVLPLAGSRGKALAILQADFLVDDTPKNCVDAVAESGARPILISRSLENQVVENAKRLGILSVATAGEALDVIERGDPKPEPVRRIFSWT